MVKRIGDAFLVRPLDTIELKGKKEKVKIYELVAQKQGPASIRPKEDEIALCQAFDQAYTAYVEGQYGRAKELFTAILKTYPEDGPTQYYLNKLSQNS